MHQKRVMSLPAVSVIGLLLLSFFFQAAGNTGVQASSGVQSYLPLVLRQPPCLVPAPSAMFQEDDPAVTLRGSWLRRSDVQASGGSYAFSDTPGDRMQVCVSGDSVVLLRRVDTDGGQGILSIDGVSYGSLEFYFPERRWQVPAVVDNLGSGNHTLTLQVSNSANQNSLGHKVYLDAFAVPSPYVLTVAQQQGLERFNWYRQMAGLPLVKASGALMLSAQAHSQYIMVNGWSAPHPHGEDPSMPGFVGEGSTERGAYFGYTADVGECMHWLGDTIPAIDEYMATVYHRNPIMSYYVTEIGIGLNANPFVYPNDALEMGYRNPPPVPTTPFLYTYPGNGQTDVPNSWRDVEIPDPLPPGTPKPVGYPASLYIECPLLGPGYMHIDTVELHDHNGQLVKIFDLPGLVSAPPVFIVPQQPMALNTTYTAHVAGFCCGVPFDHTWSFTTQK